MARLAGIINRAMRPLGVELRRVPRVMRSANGAPRRAVVSLDEQGRESYMIEPDTARHVADEAVELVSRTLGPLLDAPLPAAGEIRALIEEFIELYHTRPLAINQGGCNFGGCFWLYVTGRLVRPALLVESGVWRGQSSWCMRRAAPEAEIHSFDIDLANRVYRDPTISYHECDWATFDFDAGSARKSLVFFDDHLSHARRIEEAYAKGFRLLIFDDNIPVYQLCREAGPSLVPTLDMMFDERLSEPVTLQWVWRGEPVSARYDPGSVRTARGLIREWRHFPQMHLDRVWANRPGGPSVMAIARLVD